MSNREHFEITPRLEVWPHCNNNQGPGKTQELAFRVGGGSNAKLSGSLARGSGKRAALICVMKKLSMSWPLEPSKSRGLISQCSDTGGSQVTGWRREGRIWESSTQHYLREGSDRPSHSSAMSFPAFHLAKVRTHGFFLPWSEQKSRKYHRPTTFPSTETQLYFL